MSATFKLLAAAAAAAACVVAAVAVTRFAAAQEEPDAPGTSHREAFLERVAGRLGVDVAALEEAIKGAKLDAVDEALASGRIDEEQAGRLRARIEAGETPLLDRMRERAHGRITRLRHAFIAESAEAIGISTEELKETLRAGGSIADAAATAGVSLDDVKAHLEASLADRLDGAVAEGRIDQARMDEVLARFTARLDEWLTKRRAP